MNYPDDYIIDGYTLKNGRSGDLSVSYLLEKGESQTDIIEAADAQEAREAPIRARNKIRQSIFTKVVDRDSMLGTVADASQMLVLNSVAELVALDSADTFEAYKAARIAQIAALSGGDASGMIAAAKDLLEKVQSGEVVMPYLTKPEQATGVFNDVAERATGVAQVLQAAATE